MPNAGIHAWRSTSWKSAELPLNDAQIASVTTNTATDTISAIQRISPLLRPSLLPTHSNSTAPSTGSSHDALSNTPTPNSQLPTPKKHHRFQTSWKLGVGSWKLH